LDAEKSITCHECGSSVGNAEAFCPYCGIRLETPQTPPDESLESTIMMSPADAQKLAENRAERIPTLPQVDVNEGAPASFADEGVGSEEPAVSETEPTEEHPPAEVPTPAILSDFGQTGSNMPPPSTSEFSASDIRIDEGSDTSSKEDSNVDSQPAEEPFSYAAVPEAGGFVEGILNDHSKSIPARAADTDTPAIAAAEQHQAGGDAFPASPGPVATTGLQEQAFVGAAEQPLPEPPIPEPLIPAPEAVSPDAVTEAGPETETSIDEVPEVGKMEPPRSEGIGKPGEDLSSFDSYSSPSMFDSVRIMEPRGGDKPDEADTRLHPGSGRFDRGREPADAQDADATGATGAAIPSTSHNIGLVDTDGKKSAKLKPLAEGVILNGRYEIIRKIGGGGMGAVYLASDNNLGGVLRAVKEMVQTHIEEEQQEKAINDFKRESMILSSLDHVSIPTIYDYFYDEKESRFYLVMKYISGGDLSSRLRSAQEGRIDERNVCEWAVQIIDVLDYLHNQPSTIVYRDLKPSNVMIDGNSGRAMLIDFGIARSISQREEKGVTAVGTMGYAPPELFSGNVEPRSDIYSLGSTMFHLLTGADPQSNPLLIFDFQKNPRPRQINPQLSDQIERILMKAVQYNADERFRSAAEMRDVLEDHLLKLKAGIVTYGVGEVPASVSLANQSVFCGFCGQRIVATDMFCAFCGAKQPIAQQGVHVEIYSQAAWTAKLVIEGTSELTAPAFSLQKDDNLLGRRDPMSNIFPEVDLSKYDPQTKISRRHARIWREGTNFMVEDLGSSNGTILTRATAESFRLAPKQPQILSAGDRIRLGDATLHFIIG
jgi:serine/threonine-protein kinase